MDDSLVVFGAAVRENGEPSGSLLRRLQGALAIGQRLPSPLYLVTGGQGRVGPPEAWVMRDWLMSNGVQEKQILVDDRSNDTLASAFACARMLKGRPGRVFVCSSGYHNPRCAVLLRLLGLKAVIPSMPKDLPHLGWPKFLFYLLRETAALPWDVFLLLIARRQ
jgi:uncharacterized SAM-binding protein YcdF (DUF218 family)